MMQIRVGAKAPTSFIDACQMLSPPSPLGLPRPTTVTGRKVTLAWRRRVVLMVRHPARPERFTQDTSSLRHVANMTYYGRAVTEPSTQEHLLQTAPRGTMAQYVLTKANNETNL